MEENKQGEQALDEKELDEVAGGTHTPRRTHEPGDTTPHWVGIIK